MNDSPAAMGPNACSSVCSSASSIEALNRDCFCLGVDRDALHAELEAVLGAYGLPEALIDSHPHLFSSLSYFVSRRHIEQIAGVVAAIEEAVASPVYRSAIMAWAPEIARFDPGSPGGLLGFDFHLEANGPRLIEINTNPGGALLNAVLGQAQRSCSPKRMVSPSDTARTQNAVLETLLVDWRLQSGSATPEFVAIVDDSPKQQYLYPEFLMFRELFRRHGYRAEICDPKELVPRQNRLWLGENYVDSIYNRLTDFSFQRPEHAAIRTAYLAGQVAVSPHPRAHALYADKRNLSLLSDCDFLRTLAISRTSVDTLIAAIPATRLVTPETREAAWADRRRLFFKPAAGFGSKASYRGDKLTRRVWDEIVGGAYVSQELVTPSERRIAPDAAPLKVDVRCYAYRGHALLYAARMYRGQTTNFRTPGGGFAPVLTNKETVDEKI